ncbi:MAG: DUF1036 domain-containing protein [Devosiaceae bacterium]|nr:DUF1036 domain-containing protein [Devosiaceae bacterium MH13]
MRLLSPSTGRSRTSHPSFTFIITALIVAGVVAGSYLAFNRTQGGTTDEVAVQGRVVEGSEALQQAATTPDLGLGPTGFRVCNETSSTIGVALGYNSRQGWISEGWWNLPTETCETLRSGSLVSRYYYIYAIDYDRGGEWKGRHYMCTHARIFTIRGFEECAQRGLETTGFFEVDTAGQTSWTVQLTEESLQQ